MANILIIEDSSGWKELLADALAPHHQVSFCNNENSSILKQLEERVFDLIIFDLASGNAGKLKQIRKFRTVAPHTPVITTSRSDETDLVVKTIREGAFDFITKPYTPGKIRKAVGNALENKSLKNEVDYLRSRQDVIYSYDRIIAVSESMKKAMAFIRKLAATDSTVLMTGETGTGKSFLSGTIHFNSRRRTKPFVTINCANIPETLLESELFGHEKGAFTGATKTRAGRLEQANEGTAFLDEIGELSQGLQAKCLRVLEERCFERVGGNRTIHTDIRIIAATNRDLEDQVSKGLFREDLYYRINVLRLHLPPLRERRDCIEPLAYHFLEKICRSLKKQISGFDREVIELFKAYGWPGNIRELSNTIERAVLLEDDTIIHKDSVFLPNITPPRRLETGKAQAPQALDDQERQAILDALEKCLWVQKDAAGVLGVTPRVLNYKIKKYGITHPRWRKNR